MSSSVLASGSLSIASFRQASGKCNSSWRRSLRSSRAAVHARAPMISRASSEAGKEQPTPRPARRRPPPPPGLDPNLEVVKIETVEKSAWEGVAQIDRAGDAASDPGRVAALVAGDFAALLAFATVGHVSHFHDFDAAAIAMAALPFWLGWFPVAAALGCYSTDVQTGKSGTGPALKGWAVGIPAGVVIRSLMKGYIPDKSFLIVGMLANLVFLVGW
eukprot:CAMPEP_0177760792 /NCGR_PEP_ID=MMETSP0491_2-20121128/5458_1 /TAXON_ID=63592 /ORGANISM="Tetraselmis chuii, Strain PLY429" /LENGTH=216 /DNA_ID=CAMNT_0019276719 /DNA_START=74 /DNA_END=721 /DNA_ORIENTATION=-